MALDHVEGIGGQVTVLDQLIGVPGRHVERIDEPLPDRVRQLGQALRQLLYALAGDGKWRQVGLWKVAVVVGVLLGALGHGARGALVPAAGFLLQPLAALVQRDLSLDFEIQRLAQRAE